MMVDSLVVRILAIILKVKLRRLMGRKSEKEVGDWVLGRMVMK